MNNYILYIIIWVVLACIIILLFKFIPLKMKSTENPQTKSSLFALLMILGLPLIMFEFLAPIFVIGGDNAMPNNYKHLFGVVMLVFIMAFIFRNKIFKNKSG